LTTSTVSKTYRTTVARLEIFRITLILPRNYFNIRGNRVRPVYYILVVVVPWLFFS